MDVYWTFRFSCKYICICVSCFNSLAITKIAGHTMFVMLVVFLLPLIAFIYFSCGCLSNVALSFFIEP
jgi:hypothetical protein